MEIKIEELADLELNFPLPDGWQWRKILDVCKVNPTMSKPEGFLDTTEVSFVPMSAVDEQTGTILSPVKRQFSEVWKGYKRFQNGDVIFARITPCMENGKAAIADKLINGIGCGSTEFHVLRALSNEVLPEWLYHFVRQKLFRDEAASNFSGTAGQLRVPDTFVEQKPIPVPPIMEQQLIIAKLEAILEQIRTARTALDLIPQQLKTFRQSVLSSAFRGELTERDPNDEPADVLLERIRAERRHKWEENLHAKGKDPANYIYEGPTAPDTSNYPELPEGWAWTTIGVIGEVSGGLTKNANRDNYPLKYPYISVANVYADELKLNEVGTIGVLESEIERPLLQNGDLLVVEGNGSADQIGRVAIWNGSIENCLHQNHIIKVRFPFPDVSRFIMHWLLSPMGRDAIVKVASSTSGLYTLSLSKIECLPVPLPPLSEQKRITSKIDDLLKQVDIIKNSMSNSSRQLNTLEQAALSKAFRGEL